MAWLIRYATFPAVLIAALLGAGPADADAAGYLRYLTDHGYTGQYADGNPITPVSARVIGQMICEQLRVGRTVEQLQPNYPQYPQFPLMAEAAQQQLCADPAH
ncbi:MAG TPA: hypothetical protein VFR17_10790 [Mycobacterium sp.]|nr:hypothetical protein [Mycobacterium sp.]